MKPRVLVLCPENLVAEQLAGPNIRSLALARVLAREFAVTLGVPGEEPVSLPDNEPFAVARYEARSILTLLRRHDIAISSGTQYSALTVARAAGRVRQVFDLCDPFLFEALTGPPEATRRNLARVRHVPALTAYLAQMADYLLCASPQQRDLWLGVLYASPLPSARPVDGMGELLSYGRIGVVPYGHAAVAPVARHRVLLWGGGVWNWLDPLTPIRAVARLAARRPEVRLFFMGTQPPAGAGMGAGGTEMLEQARALAERLGLLGSVVIFNKGWVPFEERTDYLLEADLAVLAAPEGPENHFACRTRLIDALWAGTPVVCTRDGSVADMIEACEYGVTVPPGDAEALARAIELALEPGLHAHLRERIAADRDRLSWDACAEPLLRYCRSVAEGTDRRRFAGGQLEVWRRYAAYKIPVLANRAWLLD
jgi:glycosyltransferase involved in cell wall biosynthesis